jgi:hypothetical protein
MKQILVIPPIGPALLLPTMPTLAAMQRHVGGWIETVMVLDRVEADQLVYTLMVVNEEGLNDDLPRNERATVLYQRNVRVAYGEHADPFAVAEAENRALLPADISVIDMRPDAPGYASDPYIAGTVIHFSGWTVGEVHAAMEATYEKEPTCQ